MDINVIEGGVTAAKGFRASGVEAGIKYEGRKDLALIASNMPCKAAGVFTSNVVKASPVMWDKKRIKDSTAIHAILCNSGIANACTGIEGNAVCGKTAGIVARELGVSKAAVLVASTGVIGMQIPMDKMEKGILEAVGALSESREGGKAAAEAIITTDTHPKEMAVTFEIGGKTCTIGGMCKGSGMIHPNMCTMLCFLTTDTDISRVLLDKAVREVVADTFNMISVDGDMSTNDSFMVLANGLAGNDSIVEDDENYETFVRALRLICTEMAKMLAGDGEGATALFETHVVHADTKEHAKTLAKSVICSSLTKAAIFGHDANWGRILCALGYAGVDFDPGNIDLTIESSAGKILIFTNGSAAPYSEEEASKVLSQPQVTALVDMHAGEAEATAWGCDLTYDYVKINADYRS